MDDVDLDNSILTIRSTKFGKSRLVPLHPTTVEVLVDYRACREQFLLGRKISQWFVNTHGGGLGYDCVINAFHRLTAGLSSQPGRSRPRLHDLRHRFALVTLVHWYRDGQDVQRQLPVYAFKESRVRRLQAVFFERRTHAFGEHDQRFARRQ